MRLVVGLGNPGDRYAATRHNAGQVAVERLAARLGAGRPTRKYAGWLWETRGPGGPVALLVPLTFMNAAGDAVSPAAGALRARPGQVLVVHDELDLPFGELRGKLGGGVAGHNGLRSVKARLGSADFARVRLGVGRPPAEFRGDQADWVLSRFAEPKDEVSAMLDRAVVMVEHALENGVEAMIAAFHARPPGARAQGRAERRGDDAESAGEGSGES